MFYCYLVRQKRGEQMRFIGSVELVIDENDLNGDFLASHDINDDREITPDQLRQMLESEITSWLCGIDVDATASLHRVNEDNKALEVAFNLLDDEQKARWNHFMKLPNYEYNKINFKSFEVALNDWESNNEV
jgi:hypothetical protein